jgi:tripartite-type tricarboxylate transporter receptor subunit TctC
MTLRMALILLTVLAAGSPGPGIAATDPERSVRLVVPFRAGGSSDIVARTVSQRLSMVWTVPVTVDNQPGGYASLISQFGGKAKSDGRTLVLGNIALALNEVFGHQPPYSARRDLVPVALIARQPTGLLVQTQFPAETLAEFLDTARSRTTPLVFASSGNASVGHLAGELLRFMTGIPFVHTAHPRAGHTLGQSALSVPCAFSGLPATLHYVKLGKLRLLAVTDSERAAAMREVPTIGELVPGFAVNNWIGILAPYGISVLQVRRMNSDISRAVRTSEVREPLEGLGFEIWTTTPGYFKDMLDANVEQFGRLVQQTGVRIE